MVFEGGEVDTWNFSRWLNLECFAYSSRTRRSGQQTWMRAAFSASNWSRTHLPIYSNCSLMAFAEGRKLAELFEPAEFWRVLSIAPPPSVWATKRWLHLNQHGWKVYNYPSKASDYRRGRWSWWAEFQKFEHFCLWLHHQQPERQMEVASGINVLEKSRNTLPMSSDYIWW